MDTNYLWFWLSDYDCDMSARNPNTTGMILLRVIQLYYCCRQNDGSPDESPRHPPASSTNPLGIFLEDSPWHARRRQLPAASPVHTPRSINMTENWKWKIIITFVCTAVICSTSAKPCVLLASLPSLLFCLVSELLILWFSLFYTFSYLLLILVGVSVVLSYPVR